MTGGLISPGSFEGALLVSRNHSSCGCGFFNGGAEAERDGRLSAVRPYYPAAHRVFGRAQSSLAGADGGAETCEKALTFIPWKEPAFVC